LRPGERYASTLELARDVEQWLADEPVAAYREPARVRLRRWMRKHPRGVTAAGGLLLATVGGLTMGTVLLERGKRGAQQEFKMARGAVRTIRSELITDLTPDDPGTRALRTRLAQAALEYSFEFLEGWQKDPSVRQDLAEAYRQAAELSGQLGQRAASSLAE